MIKYLCDCCNNEIVPANRTSTGSFGTMEIVNSVTGKAESLMICSKCLPGIREYIDKLRNENNIKTLKKIIPPSILTK